MTRIHIADALRQLVIARASGRCEYCLLHQDDVPFSHHIDHIIPLKHGGQTEPGNLALACFECNRRKGSDLTAIDPMDGAIAPLFNPRSQVWKDHFVLEGAQLVGLTPVGRATIVLLRLNDRTRLVQRQVLIEAGRYPTPSKTTDD